MLKKFGARGCCPSRAARMLLEIFRVNMGKEFASEPG
jgi:hypothetical protein